MILTFYIGITVRLFVIYTCDVANVIKFNFITAWSVGVGKFVNFLAHVAFLIYINIFDVAFLKIRRMLLIFVV